MIKTFKGKIALCYCVWLWPKFQLQSDICSRGRLRQLCSTFAGVPHIFHPWLLIVSRVKHTSLLHRGVSGIQKSFITFDEQKKKSIYYHSFLYIYFCLRKMSKHFLESFTNSSLTVVECTWQNISTDCPVIFNEMRNSFYRHL